MLANMDQPLTEINLYDKHLSAQKLTLCTGDLNNTKSVQSISANCFFYIFNLIFFSPRYYLAESPADDTDSWSLIQRQFVVLQLLELTRVFDLADELGRQVSLVLIFSFSIVITSM
jgi:hypothetical protein